MAKRRPLALINGRFQSIPAADSLDGVGDLWNGSTQYDQGKTRRYAKQFTTDANGRVTIYLTDSGLLAGNALYSAIFGIQALGGYSGTDPNAVPRFFVESLSADRKTLVVRAITNTLSVLGVLNIGFGSAGIPVYVSVDGLA